MVSVSLTIIATIFFFSRPSSFLHLISYFSPFNPYHSLSLSLSISVSFFRFSSFLTWSSYQIHGTSCPIHLSLNPPSFLHAITITSILSFTVSLLTFSRIQLFSPFFSHSDKVLIKNVLHLLPHSFSFITASQDKGRKEGEELHFTLDLFSKTAIAKVLFFCSFPAPTSSSSSSTKSSSEPVSFPRSYFFFLLLSLSLSIFLPSIHWIPKYSSSYSDFNFSFNFIIIFLRFPPPLLASFLPLFPSLLFSSSSFRFFPFRSFIYSEFGIISVLVPSFSPSLSSVLKKMKEEKKIHFLFQSPRQVYCKRHRNSKHQADRYIQPFTE